MAKLKIYKILKKNSGQTFVEYILLLAVVVSVTYGLLNNKKFKEFFKGDKGMFLMMRQGMSYSYRFGVPYKKDDKQDQKIDFAYESSGHDTYLNPDTGKSRFFSGQDEYPKP